MPSIYREQNWIPVPIHSENRYSITLQVFVLWARANYRFINLKVNNLNMNQQSIKRG